MLAGPSLRASEHPEWFNPRPDGTIKYAENPPNKYEDIYPLDFELRSPGRHYGMNSATWSCFGSLSIGSTIFRVDKPHTKPFRFWEWLIREVRCKSILRWYFSPKPLRVPRSWRHLAKCGFSQSYSYFTWRNTKSRTPSPTSRN